MEPKETGQPHRKLSFAEGLFAAALLIRCIWLAGLVKTPFWSALLVDALTYHELAIKYVTDGFFPAIIYERAPLYPYILATVYSVFGSDPLWIRLIQACVGSLNVLLIYRITARMAGELTGRVAGILAATYGMFWLHEADILAPVWIILFLLLAIQILLPPLPGRPEPSKRWQSIGKPLSGGLMLGFATITWPTAIFAAPGLLSLLYPFRNQLLRKSQRNWKPLLYALGATAVLPLLVTLYQWLRFGEPLLSLQGGVNLYIGNNPDADGYSAILPDFGPAWTFPELRYHLSTLKGRLVSWTELDTYYRNLAVLFVMQHPLQALQILFNKFFLLLYPLEIPNTFDPRGFAQAFPWSYSMFVVGWWIIAPLGISGILIRVSSKHRKQLPASERGITVALLLAIAGLIVGIVLVFINARYRLPIVPLLIPFAAVTITELWERWKQSLKRALPILLTVITITILVQVNWGNYRGNDGAYGLMQLGLAYYKEGNLPKAEESYLKLLAVRKNFPGVHTKLALLSMMKGDTALAKSLLREEYKVDIDPKQVVNTAGEIANVGAAWYEMGELGEAEFHFKEALTRNPLLTEARRNLHRVFLRQGVLAFFAGDTATALSKWNTMKSDPDGGEFPRLATELLDKLNQGSLREYIQQQAEQSQ
ncbi:MAG: glycosyltransferase family 39 protein [bacterium]|nr:glycosyltransferase family 39 protein [bacterium]